MAAQLDCLVCGSCVVDVLCRPVNLDDPIGRGVLHEVGPLSVQGGGITSNAGITMARLGLRVGVLSFVGRDAWGWVIRELYRSEGIDDSNVLEHPTEATSSTVVAIDPGGERSFFHCVGAPRELDRAAFQDRMDFLARCRLVLLGYYSLMPRLEADLPAVLRDIRAAGSQTALDAAGTGGDLRPLDRILPHLDLYVPSLGEASHQTGHEDPRKIIETFRGCGAPGILGVKLGTRGVLLSAKEGEYLHVPAVDPPGPVVDTTGAGDCFYGGLITGLLRGLSLEDAGRLGVAAGACAVTTLGGCSGGRDYGFTARLGGIRVPRTVSENDRGFPTAG